NGAGMPFVKEPKLVAAVKGTSRSGGPHFTRMALFVGKGSAAGTVFSDGKLRASKPNATNVFTTHSNKQDRTRVRWDFNTLTGIKVYDGTHTGTPNLGLCTVDRPCFSALLRSYKASDILAGKYGPAAVTSQPWAQKTSPGTS